MKYLKSGLVVIAGFLGAAAAASHADQDVNGFETSSQTSVHRKFDVREAILRRFLKDNHSPAEGYAGVFIQEADSHRLDWRLLPSLAFVESGAGKHNLRNNLFGWDNGVSRFSTVTEAIHHVAEALAEARPYKGKDTAGKLAVYNRAPGYRKVVTGVMAQISPMLVPDVAAPESL